MEKIEIARRELGSALQLFLEDKCTVSIHVLASVGADITERLLKLGGGRSWRDITLSEPSRYSADEVGKVYHLFANAFKHVQGKKGGTPRDDADVLSFFSDEDNAAMLWKGWHDYEKITGQLPLEAQAFQLWFIARQVGPDNWHYEPLNQVSSLSYRAAKQILLKFISDGPGNVDILGNPKTEAGPLMMPPP